MKLSCALDTPRPEQASFDAEVVDTAGNVYLQVGGYETVALPESIDRELLQALLAHEHEFASAD